MRKNTTIALKPVQMTPQVMEKLENLGLIIRLCPGRHELKTPDGRTENICLYASSPAYGGHKLIGVTVNRSALSSFGSHPDNEEFILLGDPYAKTMYLVVALCTKEELNEKIRNDTLGNADFLALTVKYNDPEVSFFTMLKDIPHGECVRNCPGKPASFYVTEPEAMGIEKTDFGDYNLQIALEE